MELYAEIDDTRSPHAGERGVIVWFNNGRCKVRLDGTPRRIILAKRKQLKLINRLAR